MSYSNDYIPDYNDLYDRHEAEQERKLKKFPKCYSCGEHITDDYFYDIDGTFFCERCLNDEYRRNTEDFIEE